MIDLPEYVKNDSYIKRYKKLNQNNTIVGMWERADHPSDYNEEVVNPDGSTRVLRHYHGDWAPIAESEIKRLNDEMKKNKKVLLHPDVERLTQRERDLEAARSLLAALIAQNGGE